MRLISVAAPAIFLVTAGMPPAMAGCTAPVALPVSRIPDGTTATRNQMIAAQRAVKAYDTAVRLYTQCLQSLPGNTSAVQNAAIARDERLAGRFNAQLHAYESKHRPESSG